jgi:hypothetical protein
MRTSGSSEDGVLPNLGEQAASAWASCFGGVVWGWNPVAKTLGVI